MEEQKKKRGRPKKYDHTPTKYEIKENKRIESKTNVVVYEELKLLDDGYAEKLKSDPKYSLMPDPLNIYGFTDEQKQFVSAYVQLKNIGSAAEWVGLDRETAMSYFNSYGISQEIRRINIAMYSRQFSAKMLDLNEIGGYLTSLITDENVAMAEKLSAKEKLQATKLLIEVNTLKKNAYENPLIMDAINIEEDLNNLSIKSIKQLLANSNDNDGLDKNELINNIDVDKKFSPEELVYLKSLSTKQLLALQEDINGGNKDE